MPARKSPDDKRCSCGIGGVLRHNKVQVNNLVGFHELHVLRCAQFYSTVQDFLWLTRRGEKKHKQTPVVWFFQFVQKTRKS
jgi:hypothetical protein